MPSESATSSWAVAQNRQNLERNLVTMVQRDRNRNLAKEQLHSAENLARLVMQKAIIKEITAASKQEQAELHHSLSNGDSHSVVNGFGAKIGTISRSMPKPVAVVVDHAVVLPTFSPEDIELFVRDTRDEAVISVLLEHAPHLLSARPKETALKRVEAMVVKQWQKSGKTPEGWDIRLKDGITTIRPNSVASEAAQDLLRGITATPELERGDIS